MRGHSMNIIATQNYNIFSNISMQTKQQKQNVKEQNHIPEQLQNLKIGQNNGQVSGLTELAFGETLSFHSNSTNNETQFTHFTDADVSQKAQELASYMTETPTGVALRLEGLSMEQIATLCGGIGKQIDDAFSKGQISQQEYEDLNKGLDTYTSFITQKSELQQATWAVMRQTAEATRQKIESGASEEEMEIYAQQVKDTWKDKINAFLEENSYDKTVLEKMISLVREGKSLSFDQKA